MTLLRIAAQSFQRLRWKAANRGLPRFGWDPAAGFTGQHGQDAFVVDHFGGKRGGVFVDVGANDGVTYSNSYYLEKNLGWSGLLMEPHRASFAKLQEARSAHAINACAAPEEGVVPFVEIEGGGEMLSGVANNYDPLHRRRVERTIRRTGGRLQTVETAAVRIDRLLDERGIDRVDYLSIDTEGGELDILRSIDLKRYSVGCITIENNLHSLDLRHCLRPLGYRLAAILGCDEVYVSADVSRRAA